MLFHQIRQFFEILSSFDFDESNLKCLSLQIGLKSFLGKSIKVSQPFSVIRMGSLQAKP